MPFINTDASSNAATVSASPSLNNLSQVTVCAWVQLTSVANAARQFVDKSVSSGGWSLFKRGTDGTVLRAQYNRTTTATIADSSSGALVVNYPMFLVGQLDLNTSGNLSVWVGKLGGPLVNVTSTIQAGSGAPNSDSGQQVIICNNSPKNQGIPGTIWSVGMWGSILSSRQLFELYQRFRPDFGCSAFFQLGANGRGDVTDLSGNGLSAVNSGLVPTSDRIPARRYPYGVYRPSRSTI